MHDTLEHAPDHIRARCGHGRREPRSYRAREGLELRGADDATTLLFTGVATVFDVGYEMYGGPPYGWIEYIDAGAADKTLSERCDTQFLVNHRDMPLARTKSGTLRLSADMAALHVEADLLASDPDVIRLRPKLSRRDLDEMSFAFDVIRQEWNDDYTERHIKEFSLNKGDVSVVNYGANDSTWANDLRGSLQALTELTRSDPGALLLELRSSAGDDPMSLLAAARDAIDVAIRSAKPAHVERVAEGLSLDAARALYL